jgi:hypothetical protein
LPSIRIVKATKDRKLLPHLQHRDALLGGQRQHHSHRDTAGIDLRAPDRLLIVKWLPDDLQQANPPRHTGQVAKQIVSGLHLLDGCPALLAEAGHLTAVVVEFLPGFDRE